MLNKKHKRSIGEEEQAEELLEDIIHHGKSSDKKEKEKIKNNNDTPLKPTKTKKHNNTIKDESKINQQQPHFNIKTNKHYTISVLIPSSIVDNAQSKELRTYLIGQIARTIGIFKVEELIIYHDKLKSEKDYINYFVKNLQYLETPQYLRKTLFPKSDDLLTSGLMNPLDASHHLRINEWCDYREGCVINRPVNGNFSWVNIGLKKDCKVNAKLEERTRLTVHLNEKAFDEKLKYYTGTPVSMGEPSEKQGIYWGYVVRVVEKYSEVFSESIYKEKYDLIIGTSDKGESYLEADYAKKKNFNHCLIVFGGLQGIQGMLEDDEHTKEKYQKTMFDFYLNTCLGQGLRTIRTEEAILISLSVLKPELDKINNID